MHTRNAFMSQSRAFDTRQGIEAQTTHYLFAQATVATVTNAVIATVVAVVMIGQIPHPYTVVWIALLMAITILRGVCVGAFFRIRPSDSGLPGWRQKYLATSLVTGAIWGLCGALVWAYASFEYQAMLALVLAGMASGGIASLAVLWPVYMVFLALCLFPIMAGLFYDGSPVSVATGIMSVVFCAAMGALSRNYARSLTESWELAFRNESLVGELSSINRSAEETNRRLEEEIAERKRSEAAIRASDLRYRNLFDQAPISIWEEDWSVARVSLLALLERGVEDVEAYLLEHPEAAQRMYHQLRYVDFNSATLKLYGAKDKAELAKHLSEDFGSDDELRVFCQTAAALAIGRRRFQITGWEVACDGSDIYLRSTIFVPDDILTGGERLLCTNEDITEEHNLAKELTHQASHDSLTSLVNRRRVRGAPASGPGVRSGQPDRERALLPRPRPVQADQRHLRPLRRRRDVAPDRASAREPVTPARYPGPARRG